MSEERIYAIENIKAFQDRDEDAPFTIDNVANQNAEFSIPPEFVPTGKDLLSLVPAGTDISEADAAPIPWVRSGTPLDGGDDIKQRLAAIQMTRLYRQFAKSLVAAMQVSHLTLMNEDRWNAQYATAYNTPDAMKKYHPNFLVQFNATEADISATDRVRFWRVPDRGGVSTADASYVVGKNSRTARDIHPTGHDGHSLNEDDPLWAGSVPLLETLQMTIARIATPMEKGGKKTRLLYNPYWTKGQTAGMYTKCEAKKKQQASAATPGNYNMSSNNCFGWMKFNVSSLFRVSTLELGGTNKKVGDENIQQLADRLYMEWVDWRNHYIQQEDNLEDAIDWDNVLDHGPDAEWARRNAELAKNAEKREVMTEIGLGIVQKAGFREQCFLLSKIFPLVDFKKDQLDSIVGKRLPYLDSNDFYKIPSTAENPCAEFDSGRDGNACIQIDGSSFGFMNLLTTDPAMFPLYQAQHAQLSSLQPMMRFFKVKERTVEGEDELIEQELNFDAYDRSFPQIFSPQQMLVSSAQRGQGVGVKSFNFTYDGSNPFAVKKSIKATLVIFANSFDELMKCRGNGPCDDSGTGLGYRYIDLALKTGGARVGSTAGGGYRRGNEKEGEDPLACIALPDTAPMSPDSARAASGDKDELDGLNFRLKAVVGYAPPPDLVDEKFWGVNHRGNQTANFYSSLMGDPNEEYYNLRKAIDSSFVTLQLTPTTHDFKFDDMGRVTFTINYLAYVEDFFDQRHFNIFTDLEVASSMWLRRLRLEKMKAKCKSEEVNKLKEKEKESVKENKMKSLQALTQRVFKTGRVQYLNITYDQLRLWQSEGPYVNMGDLAPIAGQRGLDVEAARAAGARIESEGAQEERGSAQVEGDEAAQRALSERLFSKYVNDMDAQNIPFFYVGDLVDTILEGIDNYLAEDGMEAYITAIDPNAEGDIAGLQFISECDKIYEIYKLKKFANEFKHFRAVLGPVEIINPIDVAQSRFVNFGDLPISVKYFNEWLTSKLLRKDRAVFTLPRFLNDFFNHLLRNFLNNDTCFNYNIKQKIRLNQATVTDYASPQIALFRDRVPMSSIDTITFHTIQANFYRRQGQENSPLYQPLRLVPLSAPEAATAGRSAGHVQPGGYGSNGALRPPLLNISGPGTEDARSGAETGPDLQTNYMIFYAGRSTPTEQMLGHLPTDVKNGIMHYNHGQDVGIVKRVELTKTQSPGLAEVRYEQDGFEGLDQLRVMYDTTISTFCLPNVFPGQYLYVDPRSFSPSEGAQHGQQFDLTRFGIGGYFMAHKIEHRLAVGEAETKIHAKWVSEVTKEESEPEVESDNDGDDVRSSTTISKCNTARQNRSTAARGGPTPSQIEPEEEDTVANSPAGGP